MKYRKFYILLLWILVFLLSSPIVFAQETTPVEETPEVSPTQLPIPTPTIAEPSPTPAESPAVTLTPSPLPTVSPSIIPEEEIITPTPSVASDISPSPTPSVVKPTMPMPASLSQKDNSPPEKKEPERNDKNPSNDNPKESKKSAVSAISPKPTITPKESRPQRFTEMIEQTYQSIYFPPNISKLLKPENLYAGTTLSLQTKRILLGLSVIFMLVGFALIDKSKLMLFRKLTKREPFYLNKYPIYLVKRTS